MRQLAIPITPDARAEDALLAAIGDARIVLLGEATHGSAEFYIQRARITQRLIADKEFSAIALEAGWEPMLRANAYIHGRGTAEGAAQALHGFRHFPNWTWRNPEFADFLDQLKIHNANLSSHQTPVSLYGMDIYEAPAAIADVLAFLRQADPAARPTARRNYRCFAPYTRLERDPSLYGRDVVRGWMPNCAKRVASQRDAVSALHSAQPTARSFAAAMSARAVVGAEAYYRTLYAEGGIASWNVRERHLADTVDTLLERHGKLVVWAHNTHQGDARATAQAETGELSLGQLMRERHGAEAVFLLGMSTYSGSVRAASGWATRDAVKLLQPALAESWPGMLHEVGWPAFLLLLRDNPGLNAALDHPRLDRAVGVNYLPQDELRNHYHTARFGHLYDAVLHIDRTRALDFLP